MTELTRQISGSESKQMMSRKSFCGSNSNMNQLFRPEFGSSQSLANNEKLWHLMQNYLPQDKKSIQEQIVNHVEFSLARTRFDFHQVHCYQAVSRSIRDRLIESFNDTQLYFHDQDCKRVYYLSIEFLIGRCLQNAVSNLGLQDAYGDAISELGYKLEDLYEEEADPALGNGGLGRLAACFLDSLATLNYPAFGYGIRYSYGIFKQLIQNGQQVEAPDYWLEKGNPWEIERLDVQYPVKFYGRVVKRYENGQEKSFWEAGETLVARAYDTPIPGYMTFNTIALRLWRSVPANEFDFTSFNEGDYFKSLEAREKAEYITSVLYPNDSSYAGKELRLKQEYLLVSATLQDIIRRFKKVRREWTQLSEKVAIQLNDTHPSLAIVELLRILVDQEGMTHANAWEIVSKTFGYTNHTVLPEALEKWGVDLIGSLLPRHLEIIYFINMIFLNKVSAKFPGDAHKLSALSLIEEGPIKKIRMANLSIIGSHMVNGVARIHSDLLKSDLFKDHYEMRPKKFINITNGVAPRRWLRSCNPQLASLYDQWLGTDEWVLNMDLLKQLESKAEDQLALIQFMKVKRNNKLRLIKWVRENCNVEVCENTLFDIQVKRIHEYKRQFMNILYVIYRYLLLKDTPTEGRKKFAPRTVFFGGKAAPGYLNAKRIIKLINAVAEVVNHDLDTNQFLKVVFLPNYNVSSAEIIIPASDISQHISTAGTEASGTSNMKFVMNGGIILGTWDGANVEIAEEVGLDNIFIFGARVEEVGKLIDTMKSTDPLKYVQKPLWSVIEEIRAGKFGHEHHALLDSITNRNDFYLVAHDFYHYAQAQIRIDQIYQDKIAWATKAFYNSIRSGKFSSDRTIHEYAKQIWQQPIVFLGKLNQLLCPNQQHPNKIDSKYKSDININIKKMINEFLNIIYKWCGDEFSIIQGYVLCDDPIAECSKYLSQYTGPATFSDEAFKILAAKLDQLRVVIIFSNTFLIDPSKCSFILSSNGQQLPFYPKQIEYGLNLQTNYKITLNNNKNTYNFRVQMFLNTFERSIASGSLIPILICPRQLLSNIWEYLVEQNSYTETLDDLHEAVMVASRQVKLSNAIIANTLINGCALFQKYIQIKPKYSKKEMEDDIMNLVFSDLEHSITQFSNIPTYISQNGKFLSQLMILVKNMIAQFFQFIEETIELIMENEFDQSELCHVLEGQVENQVGKFTISIHEFALVEQADFIILFEKIKETIFDLHKDIELFIVNASTFVNEQMQKVNSIFSDYPALANVRTFQAIQTDASQHIVKELRDCYLTEKYNFWRPEFQKKTEFVKKVLVSYLDYNKEQLNLPAKTNDFFYSLVRMGLDPKMPIQTIQIIVNDQDQDFIKEKDTLFVDKIIIIKNGKSSAFKIYLHTNEQVVLYMIKNQVILVSFALFNKQLWREEKEFNVKMSLSKAVQFILETNIEYIENVQLYESNGCLGQDDSSGSLNLLDNFSMNMKDSLIVVKKQFLKKIEKAQKVGGPQPTDPSMLAAGAIGSGIGIFIVDCLDDNITWQQKLQRAGYGTAETTAFAALSMNLPFVGFLVGQTFLFYSVHKVFSNKVLSMQNKLKNMGHLGVKTSMGVGSAVAGQILIPIPVLGALIGSVVGGVGVGLYHKFVIPSTKNSLLNMVARLEQFMLANGQLEYEKQVIKIMRINPTHFFENQPSVLNCSDWLTLIAVHLVNEVQYLYEMQCEEQRKKLMEKQDNATKVEQLIKLDNEQDEAEQRFCKWELSRYYIYKENISTFKYAKQVGEFVAGMITNFKI